jgi:hypothetical protein
VIVEMIDAVTAGRIEIGILDASLRNTVSPVGPAVVSAFSRGIVVKVVASSTVSRLV